MYQASDGTYFHKKKDYRQYEMETRYTFRNKISETLVKQSGSIQGQPFIIANCKNCSIRIFDHCDQVQIDDVEGCQILIGASSGSIFIRNTKNCSFTVACKQFRARDCIHCTVHLHCDTEPIIETSSHMSFSPLHCVYTDHKKHMLEAHLDPECNLWYKIFDFNDKERLGINWSLLKKEECDEQIFYSNQQVGKRKNYHYVPISKFNYSASKLKFITRHVAEWTSKWIPNQSNDYIANKTNEFDPKHANHFGELNQSQKKLIRDKLCSFPFTFLNVLASVTGSFLRNVLNCFSKKNTTSASGT